MLSHWCRGALGKFQEMKGGRVWQPCETASPSEPKDLPAPEDPWASWRKKGKGKGKDQDAKPSTSAPPTPSGGTSSAGAAVVAAPASADHESWHTESWQESWEDGQWAAEDWPEEGWDPAAWAADDAWLYQHYGGRLFLILRARDGTTPLGSRSHRAGCPMLSFGTSTRHL